MASFSLFEKNTTFDGIYIVTIVNRMQITYLLLIMPRYLVHPYMIWIILASGILSQLNVFILSKWFSSYNASTGYEGFVQLFGERIVRLFAFLGIFIILNKSIVLTLGFGEIVRDYIFPSMNSNWIILSIYLVCFYIAAQGLEKTIRIVVIVFLSTIWMLIVFIPFFLPPLASLHHIYPLIPIDGSFHPWKQLLFVWSALSGPELLVFFAPWFRPKQNLLKYLTVANVISVSEYLYLFVAASLFFGSTYLSKTAFPIVEMVGYLQFPIFERIDIILISIHLFTVVFATSIFLLTIYAAVRIVVGSKDKQTTRSGFTACWLLVLTCSIIMNELFWKSAEVQMLWLHLEIWSRTVTYLFIPSLLLAATKLKGQF